MKTTYNCNKEKNLVLKLILKTKLVNLSLYVYMKYELQNIFSLGLKKLIKNYSFGFNFYKKKIN